MPAALVQVRIQTEDFDLGAEVAALHAADARVGAVVAFVGLVRQIDEAQALDLSLIHI